MIERPILFSAPMVRAILEGTKTQTRRLINPQPLVIKGDPSYLSKNVIVMLLSRSKYQKGMHLWVRETWADHPDGDGIIYRATDPGCDDNDCNVLWRPSIFMRRGISRITLEITNVSVQRLQEIDAVDARAEGIVFVDHGKNRWGQQNHGWNIKEEAELGHEHCLGSARHAFINLWNKINEKRGCGWNKNLWVWAISFKKI